MNFKKVIITGVVASVAVAGLASCGGSDDGLKVYIGSTPQHIDPALNSSVDGATYDVHLFSGLVKYAPNANGELELVPDLATSFPEPVIETDGKATYTFTLRDDAKFSNGETITAQDFVDSWNRAASQTVANTVGEGDNAVTTVIHEGLDADYGYMFEVIDGYGTEEEKDSTTNFLNVTAVNDNTLKVVTTMEYSYFKELCAFPAYMVLYDAKNLDKKGNWARQKNFVSSGAYTLSYYKNDVKLVLEKNDNYWDSENVTTEKITCVFATSVDAVYGQYLNGELLFIDDMPLDNIQTLMTQPDYHVVGQLGTYYACWNIDDSIFGDFTAQEQEEIRLALGKLIDRNYIVNSVTQSGETPATGFVASGLTDPAGGEFIDHNGPTGNGEGWFGDVNDYEANCAAAVEVLKKYFNYNETTHKFTNFPTLPYLVNSDAAGHTLIGEAIQSMFAEYGIKVTVSGEVWATFLETRKDGDYTFARNGWLGDYNDPISFLDMWTSTSGNNDCQFGKGNAASFNHYVADLSAINGYESLSGTWADTYDVLIGYIKVEKDTNVRYQLMHAAETLLMSTGAITPIYNYIDNYLQSTSLENVYVSPLGYKFFQWAIVK